MPFLCSGMVAASSALPATSPAECIWQQCARQQIAATYHATCRRACYREQAARLPAAAHAAVALQPRNYRKKATAGTPVAVQPVAVHAAATCCQDLPAAHTTVHTAVALPPRKCRRACRRGILPCSGARAQRAGDSDVGANDKGAGDDPGDGVDAH